MTLHWHEHYDADQDTRWPCSTEACLVPEVAPVPAARPPVEPPGPLTREVLRAVPWDLASVLALDLGTRTGWALRVDGKLESGVQAFDVKRGESPGMRFVRFNTWLRDVTAPLLDTVQDGRLGLLAYEAAHHRGGAATEVAVGFTTRVQEHAARWQLNHVSVHTATLKKWVTGSGRAGKPEMAEAIKRRGWLPSTTRVSELSDDELDAVGLLHYVEAEVLGGKGRR